MSMETQTAHKTDIIQETARADFYSLLVVLLKFPTNDVFSGLGNGSLKADFGSILTELEWEPSLGSEALSMLNQIQVDTSTEVVTFADLRQEYTRLFTHPKAPVIALYEGVFLNKEAQTKDKNTINTELKTKGMEESALLFINRAALDAERQYRQAGLKRTSDMNIPADCMSTEMEFMQYLHMHRAKALLNNNSRRIGEVDAQIWEFAHLHLEKWGKDFFSYCFQCSKSEVYQVMGLLGSMLMDLELGT